MESSRWTATLLLMLTFALGLSLGFIIHSQFFEPSFREGPPRMGPAGPGFGGDEPIPPPLFDRMVDVLELSPEQQDALTRALDENRERLMAFRRDVVAPRQRAMADSVRIRIEEILTPEQMRKFRELRQTMRRERGVMPGRLPAPRRFE
jgi:hypothetical protein